MPSPCKTCLFKFRRAVIVGSAPGIVLPRRRAGDIVVACNGAISSVTDRPVDVLVLNARSAISERKKARVWSAEQSATRHKLYEQLSGRSVRLLVLLARGSMRGVRERLQGYGFSFDESIELDMHESLDQVSAVYGDPFPIDAPRTDLATLTAAQREFVESTAARKGHAHVPMNRPSNGLTAACLALNSRAREVVLCGFSMSDSGYQYDPTPGFHHRIAHVAADRELLGRLVKRYTVTTTAPALLEAGVPCGDFMHNLSS